MKSGRWVGRLWNSGQSVEAQRRGESCQHHWLVEAWLVRRPLDGKLAFAGLAPLTRA